MKTKMILLLSIVMMGFACKSTKTTQKDTGTYRVIVSFISKAQYSKPTLVEYDGE